MSPTRWLKFSALCEDLESGNYDLAVNQELSYHRSPRSGQWHVQDLHGRVITVSSVADRMINGGTPWWVF